MDTENIESIIEEAALEHRTETFTAGSLWWVSEAYWRNAGPVLGRSFSSTRTGHPGAILSQPQTYDQVGVLITAGRTPRHSIPRDHEVFVELRPQSHPEVLTRFGGYDGFIGMIPVDRLLGAQEYSETTNPESEFWILANEQLDELDEDDFAALIDWMKALVKKK